MNIVYIFNWRLPSEKPMGYLVMKTCETFVKFGHRVTLVVPTRFNHIKKNPFDYHHIKRTFRVRRLPSLDLIPIHQLGRIGFFIQTLTFGIALFFYVIFFTDRKTVFYSNEQLPWLFIPLIRPRAFAELHDFFGFSGLYRVFYRHLLGTTATNEWKLKKIREKFGVSAEQMMWYPNAVDVGMFALDTQKESARARLGLPQDRHIFMYTGHLFSWKGPETLALTVRHLPPNALVYFVGGMPEDQAQLRRFLMTRLSSSEQERVIILPHQDHALVPIFLRAADVLVMPGTAREEASKYSTSPVKLFEYMASGRPIVVSNLPSIRSIVGDDDVFFVEPDNPKAFAEGIIAVLRNREETQRRTIHARETVKQFSWEKRIAAISEYMTRRIVAGT